jgi:hypothetical protein
MDLEPKAQPIAAVSFPDDPRRPHSLRRLDTAADCRANHFVGLGSTWLAQTKRWNSVGLIAITGPAYRFCHNWVLGVDILLGRSVNEPSMPPIAHVLRYSRRRENLAWVGPGGAARSRQHENPGLPDRCSRIPEATSGRQTAALSKRGVRLLMLLPRQSRSCTAA